jgi:tetratricopeptide (TPR) repeat protein
MEISHLEEAVAAFRAALEERPRERDPVAWATTQYNLGTALEQLGDREEGTQHLKDAVAVFRAALEERTRERDPLAWAMAQANLGIALARLGERGGGTRCLEEGVAALQAALEEFTASSDLRGRGRVFSSLSFARTMLSTERLFDEVYRGPEALNLLAAAQKSANEYPRERDPLVWALRQVGLGQTLMQIAQREEGAAHLEEAVAAFRAALEELTREVRHGALRRCRTRQRNLVGFQHRCAQPRASAQTDLDER